MFSIDLLEFCTNYLYNKSVNHKKLYNNNICWFYVEIKILWKHNTSVRIIKQILRVGIIYIIGILVKINILKIMVNVNVYKSLFDYYWLIIRLYFFLGSEYWSLKIIPQKKINVMSLIGMPSYSVEKTTLARTSVFIICFFPICMDI